MPITRIIRGIKIGDSKILTSQDCLTTSGRLYSSILSLLHYERHQTQRGTRVAEGDVAEERKDYLQFSKLDSLDGVYLFHCKFQLSYNSAQIIATTSECICLLLGNLEVQFSSTRPQIHSKYRRTLTS